jgi:ribosomal protein S18 acetylase RimI-like enzyme
VAAEIREESPADFSAYARVPIAFHCDRVLDVEAHPPHGPVALVERRVDPPFTRDYDALPGNHPTDWPAAFDVSGWGIFAAVEHDVRVGGAVVAMQTPGLDLLEGRADLAVLWDIRVAPAARKRGVGTALFTAAEHWARCRGATELLVETQNVNVPACRFYASQGCHLRTVRAGHYAEFPGDVQLLWVKSLSTGAPPRGC